MKKITLLLFFMAFALPASAQLSEDFESWTPYPNTLGFGEGAYGPPGWYIRNVAPHGPAQYWRQQTNSGTFPQYEGNSAAFIDRENVAGSNVNTSEDWLISPQFNVPENAEVRFFSRLTINGDDGTRYDVRIGTDPADPSTFTSLIDADGWTETEINPVQQAYIEKIIPVPAAYEGQQLYIAFIMKGDQGDRWLLDNVSVVSQCLDPTLASLTAENIGSTMADLSWDNPSGATSWEVEVVESTLPPSGSGDTYSGSLPITVTGLSASTCYKYYVRALCADGGTSEWIGPYDFCTSVCEIAQQCTYSFIVTDSWGDGWNGNTMTVAQNGIEMGTLSLATGTGPNTIDIALCDGEPFTLFWNSGGGFPGEVGVSVVNSFGQTLYTKAPGTGAQNTLLYTGQVNCSTPECLPVSNLTAAPITTYTATLNWGGSSNVGNWEYYVVPTGTAIPDDTTPGVNTTTKPVVVDEVTTTGDPFEPETTYDYYVRVVCENGDFSTWAGPFTFTTLPTCPQPINITTSAAGDDEVTINWTEIGTATEWEVYVVTNGSPAPTEATTGVSTTDTPMVYNTGLTPGTIYQVYVRAICSDTDQSDWSGPVTFNTTICNPDLQCNWSFILTDSWGDGWNGNTMTVSQNGITIATLNLASGTGPQTVTVPVCSGFPLQLFWNTGGAFAGEVGVSVVNNFDQTIFTKPPGTGAQNTVLYTVTEVDCLNPMCLPPTGLDADNFTTSTADISWDDDENVGGWEYYVVPDGDPAPAGTDSGTFTDTNSATVNSSTEGPLTPATNYEYYLRAVCGDDDTSEWVGPFPFNTTVCEPEEQCNYTFQMSDSFGDGWNGNTMTIFQGGVPVATIGSTFTGGTGPINVQVPMCPDVEFELVWNTGGFFATEVAITVFDAYMEDVYTKPAGTGSQGTTLFTGMATCTPPPCPKPQNLTVTAELESATFEWTEMGSATTWEYFILPFGADAPEETDAGTATTDNPLTVTPLDSGTSYQFYVRAICGGDNGNSSWSGPLNFTTLIANDDCADATPVPVNPGANCVESVSGTLTGATASGVFPSCIFGTPQYDVFYSFEATNTSHAVSLTNAVGGFYNLTVFSGECGSFSEEYCGFDTQVILDDLTVGETYYVMVYATFLSNPAAPTSFNLCVTTPEPPIYVSETDYTVPELIQDVFIGSECAYVDNFEVVTGTDVGKNGVGYFTQNGSSFPFEDGIVLVSGDAETDVPGPNGPGNFGGGWENPDVEAALETILADYPDFTGGPGSTHGSTSIKFDFAPVEDIPAGVSLFTFLFASNEYGNPGFECNYSDVFAFILTDLETNESVNLAVLPNGQLILVTNIHPVNTSCPDDESNPELFGQYNGLLSPINLNGQTIPMDAITPYVLEANHTYSMQMIIANEGDDAWSSAIFLLGGSMNLGEVPLGDDLTVGNGTAICDQQTATIESNLNPDTHTFQWFLDGELLDGETGPSIVAEEPGVYTLEAPVIGTTCVREGEILIEYYEPIEEITEDPIDLTECNVSGYEEFDLTLNNPVILDGLDAADFEIVYYLSEGDAINETGALGDTYTNTVQFSQTLFVRITNINSGCTGIKQFDIIVNTTLPEFTVTDDFSICEGNTATVTVTPVNFAEADATFTWTLDGDPYAQTGATITVTEGGVYEVLVNNDGCIATETVTITTIPAPIPDAPVDVEACDSYTLPALAVGDYYTGTEASGEMLEEGDEITETTTLYVYAASDVNDCFNENSFTVTITNTPVFVADEVEDVYSCEDYMLPALTVGEYYDAPDGGGNVIPVGTILTANQTIYVHAVAAGNAACVADTSFEVNIIDAFAATIDYGTTPYCTSDGIATVQLTGDPGGVYTTTDGLTIDPATGAVDLAESEEGTYTVTYTIPANATCDEFVTTAEIVVLQAPEATIAYDGSPYCPDAGIIPVTLTGTAGGAYFADAGLDVDATTGDIDVSNSTPGTYTVTYTVFNGDCTTTATFDVTVSTPAPAAVAPADTEECEEYILPVLADGSYFTGPGGTGTELSAGEPINVTTTLYVYTVSAENDDCTDEASFTITITQPVFLPEEVADVTACDSYSLPALSVAGAEYYTQPGGPNGSGTVIPVGTEITDSQSTIYVYAASPTNPACFKEAEFEVTITTSPVIVAADVAACDSYTLPALTVGNYYTGSGGTGTQLAVGAEIPATQTVYIYAVAAANADCTAEESFTVTIIPTPEVAITQGCNEDNAYELQAGFIDGIYNPDSDADFVWTDSSGAQLGTGPSLIVSQPGQYFVTVTPVGDAECPFTTSAAVEQTTCTVQRGISPNNDGLNDSFDLTGLNVSKLSIFNRYGTEVYSYGNYTNQWHGQSSNGEELPTGTYFYTIERTSGESATGWVYINREVN